MSNHTAKRRKLSCSSDGVPGLEQPTTPESSLNASRPARMNISKIRNTARQPGHSAEMALASGLYKSSLFKLQMDELIAESRPNYDKHLAALGDTLHELKDLIERLPEKPAKHAVEAEKEMRNLHGVTVPYPEPRPSKDTKYSVVYARPTNVNVVGSFALRTGSKLAGPFVVDMAVTMPGSIFQEKDYVNYRYFHKRAYFVACIAAGIKDKKSATLDVKYELQDGDELRPIISVQPAAAAKLDHGYPRYRVRILTAVDDTLFPISRTLPMKVNIRNGCSGGNDDQEHTFYNSSLRSEATVALYHKLLSSAARASESFRDACLLGRIWLRQRGFGSSVHKGGFGGFEWTVLMSLLLEGGGSAGKPLLLKSYSSYQLFKATIQFLAAKDLTEPLLLSAREVSFPSASPVVYDGKRGLNVLYKMTPWSYSFLRQEAGTTLRMLNESREDNFERIFIFKIDEPLLRFDRLVTLPVAEHGDANAVIQRNHAIYGVLQKALGDRVNLIYISSPSGGPSSVESKPHRKQGPRNLSVGLLLDSDNATRIVDHGPSAEQKEAAAAFRSFWGERAELRRFKDGSIRESLVWSEDPSSSIVHQILVYILGRHFAYGEADIGYIGDEFDAQLRNNGDGVLSYSSSAFQMVTDGFNALEKSIQAMEGVPLTVRHLTPTSPLLRYTGLHVDRISGAFPAPADVALQFESSARWPDDLVAIQMTKVAFLVKIGDALTQNGDFSSCQVGLENEQSKILNNAFLDVTHVSGIVYRLRIHQNREQTLLERRVKEQGASPQTKQEIASALAVYKRSFIHSPRLSQAMRTLCTRFPFLSPTVRLLKHWFSCHLFDAYVNEELIELVVLRTFTQPYPWEPPSSVMAGFLRTLHFLSRWNWQQEPMIVDLGGELDQSAVERIRTRFAAWRSIDPAMNSVSMFVGSDIDPDGVTWTQYGMPPKVVAARICTLAKAVMKLVREQGLKLDIPPLFRPALEPYDFVIHLDRKLLQDRSNSVAKFKNLSTLSDPTRAGKHTIVKDFVRDLQACFSPNILFFHGKEQSDVIGGLWNPQTLKPKSWSLALTFSTQPGEATVSINRVAMLNEISRLGLGVISRIDVQNG
ncbi:rRNA-processing protein UTP22 [Aspergillus lucknowensis]|uniref:U3 small nucleolar RNA-associated protein 22 n=1 Tax=Aspergillus lucknowensis TaxID=176173 RepID=A0ABR4LEE7_9EURO